MSRGYRRWDVDPRVVARSGGPPAGTGMSCGVWRTTSGATAARMREITGIDPRSFEGR
ncbi:MAG TPA: hypothetical protein VIY28_11945 [Pseudonocardiaceae bacterium]